MGLFDKIFGRWRGHVESSNYFKTLTAYSPTFSTWSGSIYESELVRAAIDARARHISKLKFEYAGAAKPKLMNRMRKAPNEWQTWSQFLYRVSTILDMQNTCFVVPVFDQFEEITGYYPVLPNQCELIEYRGEPWLRYTFTSGQKAAVEFAECAVLTKFQYADDFFGADNTALIPTMQMINIQNQGLQEAIKNANTYRFMAKLNNFVKPEDLKKEAKRFSRETFQSEEGGGVLLFPNTYSDIRQVNQAAYSVNEKEREEIRTNVYNYFGVNEDVLQNRAYGDSWQAFYEGAIEPFAIQFSEVMTKIIYTFTEQGNGNMIMLTSNRLQYMSTSEKLNVSAQLADRGILNRDEVREIWNLPPLPNGEGQAYIIRGEYKAASEATEESSDE